MFLKTIFDKLAPLFNKGGKLEKFEPLFEGTTSFFLTSGEVTNSKVHVRDNVDLKRLMIIVWLAVIPAALWGMFNLGHNTLAFMDKNHLVTTFALFSDDWRFAVLQMLGFSLQPDFINELAVGMAYFLPLYAIVFAVGGFWEVLFCIVKGHPINEGFFVTSILFALIVPPSIPLWEAALGISFGVVIGKEIFGGTGMNFMNPALVGRAFLFFAYPAECSGDKVWIATNAAYDGSTGATPLAQWAAGEIDAAHFAQNVSNVNIDWLHAFFGFMPGAIGEVSTFMILIGLVILLFTKIASWRIVFSIFLGMTVVSTLFNMIATEGSNPMLFMPFYWHFVLGGFAFGMVFMATDPVTSPYTKKGKYIYGFLIGAMVVLIRVVNPAFPEGMMLAILFGNMCAPLIDYMVKSRNIKKRLARAAKVASVKGE